MSERSIRRMRRRRLEKAERGRRIGSKLGLAGGAALGATVVFAPGAQADTFTVTNLDDAGAGSLRDAVEDANLADGADVIAFQSGLSGEITLTTGQIEIQDALDIQGPGADVIEVNGNDSDRIFYVEPTVNGAAYDDVRIAGLTLSEGSTPDGGGAVYSDVATLTLEDLVVSDNHADDFGGALYTDRGKLSIIGSSFTGNIADTGAGGAVYVDDTENSAADDVEIAISDSSFIDNESASGDGGALDMDAQGSVVIERTTITGNSAGSGAALEFGDIGGGLQVSGIEGDFIVRDSTFSENTAFYGGAMRIGEVDGTVMIENSTISGNSATYSGGGIFFAYLYDDQETTIRNSTIVDNAAGSNPGGYDGPYGGGGVYLYDASEDTTDPIAENGPVTISSSIVANNTVAGPSVEDPDLMSGEFADGFEVGHSLIEDPGDAEITADPAGSNITGQDPSLGALGDNGGPTPTVLPNLDSAGARRRDRQRPHIRPARSATHLRRGGDRQQRRLRRHRHRCDRAAAGRERPARQRLLPGRRGRLEDRHRGPRHADRHRRPRRALRRRRRRRPRRTRRQRLSQRRRRQGQAPTAAAARTWSRARPERTSSRAKAARTSSRAPAARTRQTAAAARTRSPAAPARTRSRAARARTSSRATAARTSSRPPTESATRSTAAAATRTRPRSTPRTRSRTTARR